MNPDGDLLGWRRVRFLLVLLCIVLGLWIAVSKLVVPAVIESAFRGESLPVLNSLIQGHATHSVDEYVRDWEQLAGRITVSSIEFGVLGLILVMVTTSPTFFRKFVGEATPGTLGAMRAWICGVSLVFSLTEDLASIAWMPVEARQPVGVMKWLYMLPLGIDKLVTNGEALAAFQLFTELLLLLGIIGLGTRLAIPLATACFLILGGILRDYSFNWHQGWVPLYLLIILCFTPCGDGWSVDRLLKVVRGRPVQDSERALPVYGWSRYACWVAIVLTYWETGLSKLRGGGLSWGNADGLRATFYEDSLIPREFDWSWSLSLIQVPDVFLTSMGVFVLVFEFLWITVLFSKTARKVVPILTVMFHAAVFIFQKILFIDLILLQLLFFDLSGVRKAIARRLETRYRRIEILYDGHCPLCNRTVRVLRFFDLFARLGFLDFRRLDLPEYNHRHKLTLTIEDLDREMYVISRGQPYVGYYGYRVLALAMPAFWPMVPLLYFPGVSWIGERAYGYIARNRLALMHCDTHCPMVPSGSSDSPLISRTNDGAHPLRYAWLISGFSVVMAVSFAYRVEFYPLTSWHLYAQLNPTGKITYYKVLGRQASGAMVPVFLGDAIGALRYDGRFTRVLKQCFGNVFDERDRIMSKDTDTCQKFLTVSGVVYNQKSPPDRKITHLEIQEWVWGFRSNPFDPEHGKVADHVIVEIKPISATAKKET